MCYLDICLIYHSIMQRGVNLHMSQHFLHLFYWHTLVYSHCCQGPTEFVRVNLVEVYTLSKLTQTNFYSTNGQPCVRFMQTHKQCRISVCALLQIFFEVDFSPCVEINLTLFVALAKHYTLAFLEVNVFTIDFHQLPYTHTSTKQQINHSNITHFLATVTQNLYILVGKHLFHQSICAHFVYPAHRAFCDIVFIFQPRKETGIDTALVVNRNLT